jgi:hypothetical protein
MQSRRTFLRALPLSALALTLRPRGATAAIAHPEPREGIDGSAVLTADDLKGYPSATIEIYDMIREIPHIADGIGCGCGCAAMPGYRSLLTCYHAGGMAMGCPICQGEARLAYRRHGEGQSLDQIRRAIDARYG